MSLRESDQLTSLESLRIIDVILLFPGFKKWVDANRKKFKIDPVRNVQSIKSKFGTEHVNAFLPMNPVELFGERVDEKDIHEIERFDLKRRMSFEEVEELLRVNHYLVIEEWHKTTFKEVFDLEKKMVKKSGSGLIARMTLLYLIYGEEISLPFATISLESPHLKRFVGRRLTRKIQLARKNGEEQKDVPFFRQYCVYTTYSSLKKKIRYEEVVDVLGGNGFLLLSKNQVDKDLQRFREFLEKNSPL
jgi:hypothetical protein